jgi:hypothetical protein
MARKQEIDAGTAVNMGGNVPAGHSLDSIRRGLIEDPRKRQWVIGQVVAPTEKLEHPADRASTRTPCMQFVDMVGITDGADCDQLAAMATRARNQETGQGMIEGTEVPRAERS